MAEFIKFRLRAAKAAVTMAFLALVGGAVGSADAEQQRGASAHAASFQWGDPIYLKLDGLQGATKTAFSTLEYKLNQALGSLSHKISTSFYDKHKIDTTFLKIDRANQEFLKIDSAKTDYLKIDDANANFLKIGDASLEYLKIGAQAADSAKLGGMTPDAFVQGHANVVSGMVTFSEDGKQHPLLQTPDGLITVSVSVNVDGTETLVIHNGTSSPLTAVADPTAVEYQLPAVQDTQIPMGNVNPNPTANVDGAQMMHLQIFPGGSVREVITLTVSSEPPSSGQIAAVGQMLIGLV